MENTRELNRDVTTANDQHALGQFFQKERLIGANGVLTPRDLRDLRPTTGSDQNVLGGVTLAIDFHLVRVNQPRMPFMQGHATVNQQVAVDTIKAIDFTVLVGDQGRPIKVRCTQGPAKTAGLLKVFGEMRTVHQQFLRHAADVNARTAQVAAFRHSHLGAKPCGKARRANTAGTGANYIQIKIVGHFTLLGRASAYRFRWG